jgi:hypothetical protein
MPSPLALLTTDPRSLNTALRARIENVRWMRTARLGLAANDGTFGGPNGCRQVLRNCEAELVSRPLPWPWGTDA